MELKKSPSADVQKNTGLYFNLGLAISMMLVVSGFEWKSYNDSGIVLQDQISDDFEDLLDIPLTQQPPPPPPKIQQPEIIEVPDEEEIVEDINVDLDVEITEEDVVENIIIEDTGFKEVADEIFTIVENKPEFYGGQIAFMKFLQKNIHYPSQARRMGIEGRVYVQFVVGKDGSVSQVEVLKGLGAGCDEEALRVITKSPNWIPGKQRGKPVRVRMVVPLIFSLS